MTRNGWVARGLILSAFLTLPISGLFARDDAKGNSDPFGNNSNGNQATPAVPQPWSDSSKKPELPKPWQPTVTPTQTVDQGPKLVTPTPVIGVFALVSGAEQVVGCDTNDERDCDEDDPCTTPVPPRPTSTLVPSSTSTPCATPNVAGCAGCESQLLSDDDSNVQLLNECLTDLALGCPAGCAALGLLFPIGIPECIALCPLTVPAACGAIVGVQQAIDLAKYDSCRQTNHCAGC